MTNTSPTEGIRCPGAASARLSLPSQRGCCAGSAISSKISPVPAATSRLALTTRGTTSSMVMPSGGPPATKCYGTTVSDSPVAVYSADATSGTLTLTDGSYVETKEFLGGFAVVDVADDEAATLWAGKLTESCGWPARGAPLQVA